MGEKAYLKKLLDQATEFQNFIQFQKENNNYNTSLLQQKNFEIQKLLFEALYPSTSSDLETLQTSTTKKMNITTEASPSQSNITSNVLKKFNTPQFPSYFLKRFNAIADDLNKTNQSNESKIIRQDFISYPSLRGSIVTLSEILDPSALYSEFDVSNWINLAKNNESVVINIDLSTEDVRKLTNNKISDLGSFWIIEYSDVLSIKIVSFDYTKDYLIELSIKDIQNASSQLLYLDIIDINGNPSAHTLKNYVRYTCNISSQAVCNKYTNINEKQISLIADLVLSLFCDATAKSTLSFYKKNNEN